jgi:uncharacterized protein involved in exopolysaccharide biosynthesis
MEDEVVKLREYINVLLRQWKVIVGITAIAVIVGVLVSFLSPRVYEAQAAMLVVQSQPGTLSRGTLIDVAKANTVATQVIEQLGDKLKPEEREPGKLLGKVQIGGQDNLIEIFVRDADPQIAAAMANAWIKPYESSVASLYRNITQFSAGLKAQADASQKEYEARQKAVEDFISRSRINELNRQIADYESYIESLADGLLQSPEALKAEADAAKAAYEEKQKAVEDFISNNRINELNRQINNKNLLISRQTADSELLNALKSLREQISSPSDSAATSHLVQILLQAQAFTGVSPELKTFLQQLSSLHAGLDDVDALISMLETEKAEGQSIGELQQEVNQLKAELEHEQAKQSELEKSRDIVWQAYATAAGKVNDAEVAQAGAKRGQSISELQQEISQLKAELEHEQAKQSELEKSRDIVWQAYTTFVSKAMNADITAAPADGITVQVVQDAAAPQSPVAPRRGMNIVIALVLGLVAGIVVAFVVEFFKKTGAKTEVKKDEANQPKI